MPLVFRPVTEQEYPEFATVNITSFGRAATREDIETWRYMTELDRTLAGFEDGRIVATAGALTFNLTVPGGARVPVSAVTWVGVLPTHRRRGMLREMMARLLDDAERRGEPVSILTASESSIYGRFGFGVASLYMDAEIERANARLIREWDVPGRFRLVSAEEAKPLLAPLYDRTRLARAGSVTRPDYWWQGMLRQNAWPGGGAPFYAVYELPDGEVAGGLRYAVEGQWESGIAQSTVVVREMLAASPAAEAALWQYLTNIDLTRKVRVILRPVDDPLRWMLADPRHLRVTRLTDDLWLRVLDVPRALEARSYAAAGRLVLDVRDEFRPATAARYALEAGPEGASCARVRESADLALDVADLGAAYLGGVTWRTLARAGRVAELIPGAIDRADMLFATREAPWCGTPF